MLQSRRQFVGHLALAGALGGACLELGGCSFVTDIENWVPVGIASLNSIMEVLQANGITIIPGVQTAFTDAIAALNAILTAAKAYAATTPPPVGALQTLQAAFAAGASGVEAFLSALSLPTGGLLASIVAIAEIIFSTIAAFQNKLPPAPAGARTFTMRSTYRVAQTTITVVPKERSRRAFKHDFNSQLDTAKTAGVTVPQQAYLKVTFWEHL